MFSDQTVSSIATAFVAARRGARPLADFPGPLPNTLADAYAVQEAAIAQWPDRIAGWKVAAILGGPRAALGAERLAGPAFARLVRDVSDGRDATAGVFVGGFAAVEAEFIIRIGADIGARDADDAERLLSKVAALHGGAEIASSPFAKINELGPTSVISDFGNNAGLLLGAELPGWRHATPEALLSRVWINGAEVGEGHAGKVAGGPVSALAFLVRALGERGRHLAAGDLVSTGMTTGIHAIAPGDAIRIAFSGGVEIRASIEPMRPT